MSFNPLLDVNSFWFVTIFMGLMSSLSYQDPGSAAGSSSGTGAGFQSYGNSQGYGSSTGASAGAGGPGSRISSSSASSRASSAVTSFVQNGALDMKNLRNVIRKLSSEFSTSTPGASQSDAFLLALLQVFSELNSILSSANFGSSDNNTPDQRENDILSSLS
ncbi:uncharacterized protein LOC128388119 [Panonychus citri]|nr:uncharacterized protein LOC128388119 [Panonychus citri]